MQTRFCWGPAVLTLPLPGGPIFAGLEAAQLHEVGGRLAVELGKEGIATTGIAIDLKRMRVQRRTANPLTWVDPYRTFAMNGLAAELADIDSAAYKRAADRVVLSYDEGVACSVGGKVAKKSRQILSRPQKPWSPLTRGS